MVQQTKWFGSTPTSPELIKVHTTKIIQTINVRNKNKQFETKEKILNHITQKNQSTDQGQFKKTFEFLKANGINFRKPKRKWKSYFAT